MSACACGEDKTACAYGASGSFACGCTLRDGCGPALVNPFDGSWRSGVVPAAWSLRDAGREGRTRGDDAARNAACVKCRHSPCDR